jgi:hypothetical protein
VKDFRRVAPLALLLALSACVTPPAERPGDRCGPPVFPYEDGWLGGDAAYSVDLGAGRSVWLFGDSFVGEPGAGTRVGSHFVHNSVAISECVNGEWEIDYFWTPAPAGGEPRAFLEPEALEGERYWWLFDGFVHGAALYVGLLIVEPSEPRGPLGLPFRYAGMHLARIANPGAEPDEWQVEVLPLSTDPNALPGSAMVVEDDYVYLFTFLDRDAIRYPRTLARLPLTALDDAPGDLPARLQYLAEDGHWKAGHHAADARIVMNDDASEMSVHFHSEIGRWIAVYSFPDVSDGAADGPPSDRVQLRTALRPEGPWSAPVTIYRVPELSTDPAAGRDPNTFCYAAKEHPQLARDGELILTYVCNLFTRRGEDPFGVLGRLLGRMDLYRPRVVALPLPDFPGAASGKE